MSRKFISIVGGVAACLIACSSQDDGESNVGQIGLEITAAPSDVLCVAIQAAGSGRTVTRNIDVTPGKAISTTVSGLPTGVVSVSALAYPTACSAVTTNSTATWVSDPVSQVISLAAGVKVQLNLVLRPNGIATTTIDWQPDGTAGAAGQAGAPSTGGAATGGTTGTPVAPAGYYSTKNWNVTAADWHGCAWTAVDTTVTGSTTTIAPKDFTSGVAEGGPYHVSGTVYNDYNSVAILGFNLNEAITGSSTQCAYNPAAAGTPAATVPSSATGIAVNWTAAKAPPTSFRIQIQAADGATNANHRWCATIADVAGPTFVPFTSLFTQCWNAASPGVAYAGEGISAVAFLVPGTTAQVAPFDFTINGFAPGTSKADAPGPVAACGTMTGTVGSTTASQTASMQRVKLSDTNCKQYVLQNNNFGNPTASTQVINYTGNSFTVQSSSGSGSSGPASFPSLYIGANGNTASGAYSTWADSGLPKQLSAMASAQSSFSWSGGSSGGDYAAVYDLWFAKSAPTEGSYSDAISGELMVWLYKPVTRQPVGSVRRVATIAGHNWNVWVGPRGTTSAGTDAANRPVVSYVAQDTPVSSLSVDLKAFINDAVTNGAADMSSGGTGQAFSNSWYLTDVFAGFQIWSGVAATGLKETFTCAVK